MIRRSAIVLPAVAAALLWPASAIAKGELTPPGFAARRRLCAGPGERPAWVEQPAAPGKPGHRPPAAAAPGVRASAGACRVPGRRPHDLRHSGGRASGERGQLGLAAAADCPRRPNARDPDHAVRTAARAGIGRWDAGPRPAGGSDPAGAAARGAVRRPGSGRAGSCRSHSARDRPRPGRTRLRSSSTTSRDTRCWSSRASSGGGSPASLDARMRGASAGLPPTRPQAAGDSSCRSSPRPVPPSSACWLLRKRAGDGGGPNVLEACDRRVPEHPSTSGHSGPSSPTSRRSSERTTRRSSATWRSGWDRSRRRRTWRRTSSLRRSAACLACVGAGGRCWRGSTGWRRTWPATG